MEFPPHDPQPSVVVGAKPFVNEPPAVNELAWLTTRRLTGSSTPAQRMLPSLFECTAAEWPAPSISRLALAAATASWKVLYGRIATTGQSFSFARRSFAPAPSAGRRMMRADSGTSTPARAPTCRGDLPTTSLFRW